MISATWRLRRSGGVYLSRSGFGPWQKSRPAASRAAFCGEPAAAATCSAWPRLTRSCRRPSPSVQSLRLFVRVDRVAGLVAGGRQHGLGVHGAELLDVVPLDVVELHLHHPRLRPFAVLAELDVAEHGLERTHANVVGKLLVLDASGLRDRLL